MIEEVENDIVIVDRGCGSEVELADTSLADGSHAVYPRTDDQVRPGLAGRALASTRPLKFVAAPSGP